MGTPTKDAHGNIIIKSTYGSAGNERVTLRKDGVLHSETEPAMVKYFRGGVLLKEYYLEGNLLTKKAWEAAVKRGGETGDYSFLTKRYEFTGDFTSPDFAFHGTEGVLVAVRVGSTWHCLDKSSRTSSKITKRVNEILKGSVEKALEVDQQTLESLLVEQMPAVLRR